MLVLRDDIMKKICSHAQNEYPKECCGILLGQRMREYGMKELGKIPGLHLVGTAPNKSSALSFVMDGISNDAVGQRLDQNGIAVRVGHHCAQPILRHYGLESVVCPTLALYNSFEDIDTLVKVLRSL